MLGHYLCADANAGGGKSVRIVRAARRIAHMTIKVHREIIGELPFDVQAIILKPALLGTILLLKANVFRPIVELVQIIGSRDFRIIVEPDFIVRTIEPELMARSNFALLVLREQGVGGDRDSIARTELHHRLAVDTFATALSVMIGAVVRVSDQLIRISRRILHNGATLLRRRYARRTNAAGLNAAIGQELAVRSDVPVIRPRCDRGKIALLITAEQGDTEDFIGIFPVHNSRKFGRDLRSTIKTTIDTRVIDRLGTDTTGEAAVLRIKRLARNDIDRSTDPTGRNGGAAGLVHFQRTHAFRSEVCEVERPVSANRVVTRSIRPDRLYKRSGERAPVQRDEIIARPESAHCNLRSFAVAAVDTYARDTLKRLSKVGVREFADIFGGDGVYDTE